ncbi:MFS transporter [Streptomyces sp. ST2-7A]|nr:MFS transporter [Streptomyces sp. ST2-7A]
MAPGRPTDDAPGASDGSRGTGAPVPADDLDGIPPDVYRRRWRVLTAMCTSLLTVMLANGSLNLALPSLSTDLGLTTLQQTWVIDLYSLTFAALLFTAATVGDRYGRRIVMQAGLVVFVASSAYAALAVDSGAGLILARGLMGLGAAMVMPTTLSIINNVFPRHERPRAIAVWTGIAGVGTAFGSVLSGMLLERYDWRSVFVVGGLLAVGALVANQILAPESRDERRTPVDWWGGVLSTIGILGLVYAIIEGPSHGFTDPGVLVGAVAAVLGLGLFAWWQTRTDHPMLDLKLFRNPVFGVSSLTCAIAFFALFGAFYALAQLFQLILGYGPLKASLVTLPIMLPMMILAPLVPNIVRAWGPRAVISVGLTVMAVGFLLGSGWEADVTYWGVLLPILVVIVGMALAMPPATELLMSSVPRNRSGMGSAMNDTTRELGGALGIAILGSLLASGYASGIADAVRDLPAELRGLAEDSFAVALHAVVPAVAESAGEEAAAGYLATFEAAWMNGLTQAMLVSSILAFVAAAVAFAFMPGRSKHAAGMAAASGPAAGSAEPAAEESGKAGAPA